MTYLRPPVIGNFKKPIDPNKPKEDRRAKWEGNDPEHLALIRQLPCCITGQLGVDPHHLKISGERGMGLRARDKWAVPLIRWKHDEVEAVGSRNELAWFRKNGIENPYELAQALWNAPRDLEAMKRIVEAHRA